MTERRRRIRVGTQSTKEAQRVLKARIYDRDHDNSPKVDSNSDADGRTPYLDRREKLNNPKSNLSSYHERAGNYIGDGPGARPDGKNKQRTEKRKRIIKKMLAFKRQKARDKKRTKH